MVFACWFNGKTEYLSFLIPSHPIHPQSTSIKSSKRLRRLKGHNDNINVVIMTWKRFKIHSQFLPNFPVSSFNFDIMKKRPDGSMINFLKRRYLCLNANFDGSILDLRSVDVRFLLTFVLTIPGRYNKMHRVL